MCYDLRYSEQVIFLFSFFSAISFASAGVGCAFVVAPLVLSFIHFHPYRRRYYFDFFLAIVKMQNGKRNATKMNEMICNANLKPGISNILLYAVNKSKDDFNGLFAGLGFHSNQIK